MSDRPTIQERLDRSSLYGSVCLAIASVGCLALSLVFRDVAGVNFIGNNEPPFEWGYIVAGTYNFICFIIGSISTMFCYRQIHLNVSIIGSVLMMSGATLEFVLLQDWSSGVIIIVSSAMYLVVAHRVSILKSYLH